MTYLVNMMSDLGTELGNKLGFWSQDSIPIEGVVKHTDEKPLHYVKVEVYANTFSSLWPRKIATLFTDHEGHFSSESCPMALPAWGLLGKATELYYNVIAELPLPRAENAPLMNTYTLGSAKKLLDSDSAVEITVPFLEFHPQPGSFVLKPLENNQVELQTHDFKVRFYANVAKEFLENLDLENVLLPFESMVPEISAEEDALQFGYEVINVFPFPLKEGSEGSQILDLNWDPYILNNRFLLPNITVVLKPHKDGGMFADEVTVQFRKADDASEMLLPTTEHHERMEDPIVTKLEESLKEAKKFNTALWLCRGVLFNAFELKQHLAVHALIGEHALIFLRHIRPDNPMFEPLNKLFFGTLWVDQQAGVQLVNKEGIITKTSGLTEISIDEILDQSISPWDWKNWEPMKARCKNDTFALSSSHFWDAAKCASKEFISTKADKVAQEPYLRQLYAFSEELHLSSRSLPDSEGKAISRIINDPNNFTRSDLKNLTQYLAWIAFHATFAHTWFNDHQVEMAGENTSTSMSFIPAEPSSLRDLEHVKANSTAVIKQRVLVDSLTKFGGPTLFSEKDYDEFAGLLWNALKDRGEVFDEIGYAIAQTRYGIYI